VRGHLVLWDIDYTLIDGGGLSRQLYGVVFAELFGRELPTVAPMAGRTDRAIILETLAQAGIDDPARHVGEFIGRLTAHAPQFGDRVSAHGRALPGAATALTALATLPRAGGQAGTTALAGASGPVVQSVLTGNIRALAQAKLGALGLTAHLDLTVGAYGDAHEDRADLVRLARDAAGLKYGADFGGEATVIVGDTPHDVRAALVTGARAVAVATGGSSPAELAAARPHALLPDLTGTTQVIAAILG
jgi:phosphoglycolate phosphatase